MTTSLPPSRSEVATVVLRVLSRYPDLLESGALEDLTEALASLSEPRVKRPSIERIEEVVDVIAAHLERARVAEQEAAAARTRLMQSERLATLGMLAAGIAHEINNPAAFLLLGMDLIERTLRGPGVTADPAVMASAEDLLGELRGSIRRIVDIARDLRVFASPSAGEHGRRTIVDVNRVVESALSLTRGQIVERAELVRSLEEVPPLVLEDGRLGQAVVNLLVNAAQAIPRASARDHAITVSTRSSGDSVKIEVRDTGVGVPAEVIDRIWQPFFSTKSPDIGTGLGLAISREIVERAGGEIWVESPVPEGAIPGEPTGAAAIAEGGAPPRGSRFVIVLPVTPGASLPRSILSPVPKAPAARARVLIVDDEVALGRALAGEIGRSHDVDVAQSAEEALALIGRERYGAVLCDLRMPGISGEELFTRIAAEDEALAARFIFMTGVGFGPEVERFLASAGRPVLEKPFSAEIALNAIAKVVARPWP